MLDTDTYRRLLSVVLERGGDFADVFCERRAANAVSLQGGSIHEAQCVLSQGVGIRVVAGESAGYGYSEDLDPRSLLRAARVASQIARDVPAGAEHPRTVHLQPRDVPRLYDGRQSAASQTPYDELLARADVAARAFDPFVTAVNARIVDELQEVWIATSDGDLLHDRRPLISLRVQVIASCNGERGSGFAGDGGRVSLAYYQTRTPESLAREAARIAVINAQATPAPAGEMEMVVGSGGGGVLLHEAVGHGLEGDFNRRGVSLYSGRIGERVASELVTIYDDGNLPGERGSIAVDDEGTLGAHKVLVERGVLRGYMQDRLNARLMGVAPTGSGRRESYRFLPQPRMCNTLMPSGESSVDEIVGSVKRGLYAKSFAGGQVEISKGDFVFMVAEGYLIENGAVTAPVKNATIVGNGPEIMTRVVAVGDDSRLANRHYTCGKGGQHVPVGVGTPTLKISSITVGGSHVE